MSINENIQGNQLGGDTKVPKGPTVPTHEAAIPDKQVSDKFPSWDMLPPFQFINPRVRRVEPKQETKGTSGMQATRPVLNPETTLTAAQVLSEGATDFPIEALEECPACGTSNKAEAEFCRECGLRLGEPISGQADYSADSSPRTIKCPHCGEQLELDASDKGIEEYSCPECGKDFELSD